MKPLPDFWYAPTSGSIANGFAAPTRLPRSTQRRVSNLPVSPAPILNCWIERYVMLHVPGIGIDAGPLIHHDACRAVACELEVGIVGINEWRSLCAEIPFGGVKQSGIGADGGEEGLREFNITQDISITRPSI